MIASHTRSLPRPWLGVIGCAVVLMLWAPCKIHWEQDLGHRVSHPHANEGRGAALLRQELGQGAALALMSGFRGFISDCVWISTHSEMERRDWNALRAKIELAATLQPTSEMFWENGSWQMAWNISHAVLYNSDDPRQARRLQLSRQWMETGRAFLQRGTSYLPKSASLWFALGWLCDQRLHDYPAAIEAYRNAALLPGAPAYVHRLIGYRLRQVGQTREAYDYWRELWARHPDKSANKAMMWDRVLKEIRSLENELGLPISLRLPES